MSGLILQGMQGMNLQGMQGMQGMNLQGMQGMNLQGMMLTPGADPATSLGLVLNREALVQPHGSQALLCLHASEFRNTTDDGLPKVGDTARLDRWSPEVRAENLKAELFRPLHLSAHAQTKSVTLSHIDFKVSPENTVTSDSVLKVFTVQRPPRKVFEAQLDMVNDWAYLRAERMPEIMSQLQLPLQYWGSLIDLNPTTYRYTLEFLNLALSLTLHVVQPMKHFLGCPRPVAYSPGIQPIINAGRFAVFPSGHASEAFLIARLLQLFASLKTSCAAQGGDLDKQLQRLAARISVNRVIAGVHFPIDAAAGRMVGEGLAHYLWTRCNTEHAGWTPRDFKGAELKDEKDIRVEFNPNETMDGDAASRPYFKGNSSGKIKPALQSGLIADQCGSLLSHVWEQACSEWQ